VPKISTEVIVQVPQVQIEEVVEEEVKQVGVLQHQEVVRHDKQIGSCEGWSQQGACYKIEKPKKKKEKTCPNGLGVEFARIASVADCATKCAENSRYVAFEFEPENGECELASAVDLKAAVADGKADGGDGRCKDDTSCYSSMDRVFEVQDWKAPAKYTQFATRRTTNAKLSSSSLSPLLRNTRRLLLCKRHPAKTFKSFCRLDLPRAWSFDMTSKWIKSHRYRLRWKSEHCSARRKLVCAGVEIPWLH
jgi:hypothetical protein